MLFSVNWRVEGTYLIVQCAGFLCSISVLHISPVLHCQRWLQYIQRDNNALHSSSKNTYTLLICRTVYSKQYILCAPPLPPLPQLLCISNAYVENNYVQVEYVLQMQSCKLECKGVILAKNSSSVKGNFLPGV